MDENQLLVQALAGDEPALARLVQLLVPVIQARVARVLLRRQGLAQGRPVRQEMEDLSQEVFAALFAQEARVLKSWDPARGLSLKNFVGLVAERLVAGQLRSRKRSPWTEDPTLPEDMDQAPRAQVGADGPLGLESLAGKRELLRRLWERLKEDLSPLGRKLFALLYLEECEVPEVCRKTGMKADAVYAWRSRIQRLARTRAQEILSDWAPSAQKPRTVDETQARRA